MKINIFLIKTMKSLGKHESLEEDLVYFLLDVLKSRIQDNKKKYLKINDLSSTNDELKIENRHLLNLFLKLTILKSQYSERRNYIKRIRKQIPKFSNILSNILKMPNNEILERFEGLSAFNQSIGVLNDYYEIKQKLLKTKSSN